MNRLELVLDDEDRQDLASFDYRAALKGVRSPVPPAKWIQKVLELINQRQDSSDIIIVPDLDMVELVERIARRIATDHVRVMTKDTFKELMSE